MINPIRLARGAVTKIAKQEIVIREEWAQRATWERSAVYTTASTTPVPAEHVLCVPLVGVENILGVIYLTSPATSPPFGEDHALLSQLGFPHCRSLAGEPVEARFFASREPTSPRRTRAQTR